jgi:hypothetical protein
MPLLILNATQKRYQVQAVDPATGQDAPGYAPIVLRHSEYLPAYALSADGQKLAIVDGSGESCEPYAGGTRCVGSADTLHLIDVAAWRVVTATLPTKGAVGPLRFSPDASRLALINTEQGAHTLILMDAATGDVVAQRALVFPPWLMEYAENGRTLMIYGQPLGSNPGVTQPDPPRVQLVDAATLEVTWEQELAGVLSGFWCLENCTTSHEMQVFASWMPAVVPSVDGSQLYVVHADEEKLTTVDLQARTLRTVEIDRVQSGLERLLALTASVAQAKGAADGAYKEAALSPDGTRLYVVGRSMSAADDGHGGWQIAETSLGLQVIDVESGRRVASRESEASGVRITLDGAHGLLNGWGEQEQWAEVFDVDSLEPVGRLAGWEVAAIRQVEGRPVIVASHPGENTTRFAVFDARSLDAIHSWAAKGYAAWLTRPYLTGGPG